MSHRIVVVGAGYAGLSAALGLARRLDPARFPVTMVTEDDHFCERIRLHQVAAGRPPRRRRIGPLLATHGVDLVLGRVVAVDPSLRTVDLDDGGTLSYDDLVLAVGSGGDVQGVPGAAEHAVTIADPAGASGIAGRLAEGSVRRVVVVGGGLTGVETAAELAECRPQVDVALVTGTLGAGLSPRARDHLRHGLLARGVGVYEQRRVSAVDADAVHLDAADELPTDLTVWAAGFRAPDLLHRTGFALDSRGRVLVDDRLRPRTHAGILVAGDAAAAPVAGGTSSRMSCQTGLPMGLYAGAALARRLHGREPRPIRLRYVWQNVGLGPADGVTQFTAADDRPLDRQLTGRLSASFKEAVARGAAWAARHAAAGRSVVGRTP